MVPSSATGSNCLNALLSLSLYARKSVKASEIVTDTGSGQPSSSHPLFEALQTFLEALRFWYYH